MKPCSILMFCICSLVGCVGINREESQVALTAVLTPNGIVEGGTETTVASADQRFFPNKGQMADLWHLFQGAKLIKAQSTLSAEAGKGFIELRGAGASALLRIEDEDQCYLALNRSLADKPPYYYHGHYYIPGISDWLVSVKAFQ